MALQDVVNAVLSRDRGSACDRLCQSFGPASPQNGLLRSEIRGTQQVCMSAYLRLAQRWVRTM